jgi:hypothetical protein
MNRRPLRQWGAGSSSIMPLKTASSQECLGALMEEHDGEIKAAKL